MIIKYSDKFESIFYAVLCSNITGYFLVPKSQPLGLFDDEEYIDIDKSNWQEILNEHNRKFGEVKLINFDKKSKTFKSDIDFVLRFWHPFKYKLAIDFIRLAIKYGIDYLYDDSCSENKKVQAVIKQIKNEVLTAVGFLKLIPASKNNETFLLGDLNEESKIGDLVLKNLEKKYFGFNFLLRSSKAVYFSRNNNRYIWNISHFDSAMNLAKLLEYIYQNKLQGLIEKKERNAIGLDFTGWTELAFN